MTIADRYNIAVANGDIEDDAQQRPVIDLLDRLADRLNKPEHFFIKWLRRKPEKGLYLFGPVGTGKTFLMDLFYEQVQSTQKRRFHFHHFMQQVDAQLRRLQGQRDPLQRIARELANSTRLICFDEFLVHDVAFAMILAELLKALIANGITLVATSNTRPDDLYLHGVQRERFLPAIALIKSHCEVLRLENKRDYRLGRDTLLETYLYPLNEDTQQQMLHQFDAIVSAEQPPGMITIQNREIPYVKCKEDAIWFEFKVICNLPRSQLDYLEIADRFDTVFVSNMPAIGERDSIFAIMLIHFVDVMYDRGIRLILSADVPLVSLYRQGDMSPAFKRTFSRLQEMQSVDYRRRHPRRQVQDFLKCE